MPLFSQCTAKGLKVIATSGKQLSKKEGSEVLREGRAGAAFFLILSGTVEVEREGRIVGRLQAGDYFGEMALLTEQVRNATIRAVTDVELFAISRLAFKTTLIANPTVTYNILRTVAARNLPG